MRLGEALVPEAHCSTSVLVHGNNHHRNSSSEINCIRHRECFFIPILVHSITHLKPDGAICPLLVSLSLLLMVLFFSPIFLPISKLTKRLKNKQWPNYPKNVWSIWPKTIFQKVSSRLYCRLCCWKLSRGKWCCLCFFFSPHLTQLAS